MATVNVYGPYYVLTLPENKFQPGEVRSFGFGPWPAFATGTATVSANVQDFSAMQFGASRNITVDSLEYVLGGPGGANRYVNFTYRNSGSEPIQGWYFNLTVVTP
jgi:hypothetical protein